jgi:hypothetical protein
VATKSSIQRTPKVDSRQAGAVRKDFPETWLWEDLNYKYFSETIFCLKQKNLMYCYFFLDADKMH